MLTLTITNDSSIDVHIAVEAPIGKIIDSTMNVPAGQTISSHFYVDVSSVRLTSDDGWHKATQTFKFDDPQESEGRVAFLRALKLTASPSDFQGTIEAATA